MTPEKEIEIMKWLVDNYPNHETNCVKIWELIKIINHYHESEVKKLNIPAVIKSVYCECENQTEYTDANNKTYCSWCGKDIKQ
jgi:hypothetical protein